MTVPEVEDADGSYSRSSQNTFNYRKTGSDEIDSRKRAHLRTGNKPEWATSFRVCAITSSSKRDRETSILPTLCHYQARRFLSATQPLSDQCISKHREIKLVLEALTDIPKGVHIGLPAALRTSVILTVHNFGNPPYIVSRF